MMLVPEPALAVLLDSVNRRHRTDYRLVGRFQGGENQGAAALVDQDGRPFVLKRQDATAAGQTRLLRAAKITERLQQLGAPVPRYRLIGTTASADLYSIQDRLPGSPVGLLTEPHQIERLFALNDLQAGQAISSEQDWSEYVRQVVFNDASGWTASLRGYAPDTAQLVTRLTMFTHGLDRVALTSSDIAHGDFSPGNILVHDGQISGIVDWDAAGCGDRAFDLALLHFYHYEQEQLRRLLRDRVVQLAGFEALCVYLTYAILSQTFCSAHHHGRAAIDHWLRLAWLILDDLATPTPTAADTFP